MTKVKSFLRKVLSGKASFKKRKKREETGATGGLKEEMGPNSIKLPRGLEGNRRRR